MSGKVSDYTMEELSNRLVLCVCNYEANESSLINFPIVRKGGLALYVQVATPDSQIIDGMYVSWLNVTNDRMNAWGITKDVLFEIASSSSKKLLSVDITRKSDNYDFVVINNKFSYIGSSALFYEGSEMLDGICEDLSCDNLTLLTLGPNQVVVLDKDKYSNNEFEELLGSVREELSVSLPNGETLFPDYFEYSKGSGVIKDVANNTMFETNVKEESIMKTLHR